MLAHTLYGAVKTASRGYQINLILHIVLSELCKSLLARNLLARDWEVGRDDCLCSIAESEALLLREGGFALNLAIEAVANGVAHIELLRRVELCDCHLHNEG